MLHRALSRVGSYYDKDVLIGFETADDAGVYRIDSELALVQTVDFFTPIVDDPFVYGEIAAANALSDIYAMGGRPRFALSLVGFPQGKLDEEILASILAGGASKLEEARVALIGGHSVKDPEVKFGFAVTGFIHPDHIRTNRGAKPGDVLLLTKPLGTGVISTAMKYNRCPEDARREAIRWMLQLNENAAALLEHRSVNALTDITGFGLAGHAYEMAVASGVCLLLSITSIPLMASLETLVSKGMLPGGIENNRAFLGKSVNWGHATETQQKILLDPQTSGGLLISLPPEEARRLQADLEKAEIFVAEIGSVEKREEAYLRVV